jgi:hypothetical protein
MTDTPTTAAGRALLEREAYNSRSFAIIDGAAILAIEQEAVTRALAPRERRMHCDGCDNVDLPYRCPGVSECIRLSDALDAGLMARALQSLGYPPTRMVNAPGSPSGHFETDYPAYVEAILAEMERLALIEQAKGAER